MPGRAYVFKAQLVGFKGVTRTVAVRGDQGLTDLHDVLQRAFDWDDDHLYSFWLTGRFWDREGEYTAPFELERGQRSAAVQLDRLGLEVGQKVAYVFDFGDEWRVMLTVTAVEEADANPYPRILASRGEAPPQYVYDEDWDEEAA